ncbi:putative O-methyltransferase YrrM [Neolewinella xylanilytica]|uniref:Putative O-methyltransferase YrrM n=1 Tax=Neolewinella xylanilytica TaxID=1514080 RepID=A0A2S6I2I8_9BACT|nr:class I SAM-dependent methyltransferase [Neolewinella xylanilytica]PPK85385.1 putative O-methyltransferase YrrM [Neolewinella xylanilytica]
MLTSATEPSYPPQYSEIREAGEAMDFTMPSDQRVGELLRSLVAAKPGGNFLELGTGLGLSLAWMVQGMHPDARILSLDNQVQYTDFVSTLFQNDARVSIVCADGKEWLENYLGPPFDLIFADTWPGKYHQLERTLDLLPIGGTYIVDDMLPQSNWPEGHAAKANHLRATLASREDLWVCPLEWASGVILCVKRS